MNAIMVLTLALPSAVAFAQTHLLRLGQVSHDSKALFLALDKTNGKNDGHFGIEELSDVLNIPVADAELLRNAMDLNKDGVIDEHEAVEVMYDAVELTHRTGQSAGVYLGNAYGATIAFVEGTPSGGEIDWTIAWVADEQVAKRCCQGVTDPCPGGSFRNSTCIPGQSDSTGSFKQKKMGVVRLGGGSFEFKTGILDDNGECAVASITWAKDGVPPQLNNKNGEFYVG